MELKIITNKSEWNPSNLGVFVPFTQEWFYREWQEGFDKQIFNIKGIKNNEEALYAQILKFKLPYNKAYLYCPYGPVTSSFITNEDKKSFIDYVSTLAKNECAFFLRLDQNIFDLPKMKYSNNFQPPSERVIDIKGSVEEILKEMDKNIRYSINLAKKSGVEVKIVSENFENYLDELYEVFTLSAKRNEIGLHPKEYYKRILEVGEKEKNVFLTFTRFEGKVLVTSLTVLSGGRATQIFSGSTDFYRKLRPAAITRLESMRYAKSRGMKEFSLGGVSTPESYVKEWEGISEFKKQFGGQAAKSAEPGVMVFSSIWYALYNLKKLFR